MLARQRPSTSYQRKSVRGRLFQYLVQQQLGLSVISGVEKDYRFNEEIRRFIAQVSRQTDIRECIGPSLMLPVKFGAFGQQFGIARIICQFSGELVDTVVKIAMRECSDKSHESRRNAAATND